MEWAGAVFFEVFSVFFCAVALVFGEIVAWIFSVFFFDVFISPCLCRDGGELDCCDAFVAFYDSV